jgi:hypothetical protein
MSKFSTEYLMLLTLNALQPYGPSWPVTGMALLTYFYVRAYEMTSND